MRWREAERKTDPRGEWHAWFAWHPVKVGKTTIWLETIERRLRWCPFGEDGYLVAYPDYREPQA